MSRALRCSSCSMASAVASPASRWYSSHSSSLANSGLLVKAGVSPRTCSISVISASVASIRSMT